jgi:CO dehydrogenase/acetyl-CoA synthase alpha subunit
MEPTEADSEVEEEHLLNFVVNSLNDELRINLGEDVEVTTETLYEVLAGASAGGTSIRLRNDQRLATRQHRPGTSHRAV